jgi:putative FmdB family regulatory protein
MPIYEYYCPICDGYFSHLARRFDAPAPSCPGCGSDGVEKMASRVNAVRSEADRLNALEAGAGAVNADDPQEVARFLQDAGEAADIVAPIGQEAFREIVARRAQGASDEDLQDVVDAVPFERQSFVGKVPTPHEEQDVTAHQHHHHCAHCDHDHTGTGRDRRRSRNMGWA